MTNQTEQRRKEFEAWYEDTYGEPPDADVRYADEARRIAYLAAKQSSAEEIARLEVQVKVLREAASNAKHHLEPARIWAGATWGWNALRPEVAKRIHKELDDALVATQPKQEV